MKLKPGDTIYCLLRAVSASGMTRWIDFYVIKKNQPYMITRDIADALDLPLSINKQGAKVGGAGMDMGFHCVYEYSRTLFPKGFTDKDRGEEKRDGGYAIKHSWL